MRLFLGLHCCTYRLDHDLMLDSPVERRGRVSDPRRWHPHFHHPRPRIFRGFLYRNWIYCVGYRFQLDW